MFKFELKSHPLTPLEQRICQVLIEGANNREIACELGIKEGTVKNYLVHIYDKLRVRGRVQLIVHYGEDLRGQKKLSALSSQPSAGVGS